MTTVAWDGKMLACDGRMSDTAILSKTFRKIWRVKESLVGMSGKVDELEVIKAFIESGMQGAQPKTDELDILLVHPDGSAFTSENGGPFSRIDTPCAIGSGRDFALAAMDLGFDAATAVKTAAKRDPSTGGRVFTLELNGPKRRSNHGKPVKRKPLGRDKGIG